MLSKLNDVPEGKQRISNGHKYPQAENQSRCLAIQEVTFYNKLPVAILGVRNLTDSRMDQDKLTKVVV